jgi:hypothetical protein
MSPLFRSVISDGRYAQPKLFRAYLRQLWRRQWVVYAKKPFRGSGHVLQYLARYTHRVAISNHRLIAFDNDMVTFRWRDYAHDNRKRKMTRSVRMNSCAAFSSMCCHADSPAFVISVCSRIAGAESWCHYAAD